MILLGAKPLDLVRFSSCQGQSFKLISNQKDDPCLQSTFDSVGVGQGTGLHNLCRLLSSWRKQIVQTAVKGDKLQA